MIFAPDEYARRIAKVRARMAQDGLDVLVEADPANMNYLTGYDGWSFYTPQVVVLAMDGEAVWIGRGLDRGGARLTCHMAPENLVAYPDHLVQHPTNHPMQFVAEEMARRGWDKGRIGFNDDCFTFSPRARDTLEAALANARLVAADLLVNWVRLVKSDAELALMRKAARTVERMLAAYYTHMRPGVRQCDVAAEIIKVQVAGTAEGGGDYTTPIFMPVGEQTSASHLTWTDQIIAPDQTTYLECAGVHRRYHCPLARTIHLGPPPQKLLDMDKAILEAMDHALEQVRPGNSCEQVEAAFRATLAKHGLKKESRIGYPIGIGYPPTWGERTASLRQGDQTVLEPNMCFHMILGMWQGDWGFETSESFRVTETGHECLASVPRGLKAIV
ncbi:MAG: M24 family metallopeptidase [Alphaproteobacteria bacterium]